jgi:alkylhydroperoxidase/carboxymuconolactone decarboxylase family protein YurZ
MPDTMQDFDAFRARMNELILGAGNLSINRFFALDQRAYEPGALGTKTKEMLGLVSSLVLRCDDCMTYHVVRCHEGLESQASPSPARSAAPPSAPPPRE